MNPSKKNHQREITIVEERCLHMFGTPVAVFLAEDSALYFTLEVICQLLTLDFDKCMEQISQHAVLSVGLGYRKKVGAGNEILLRVNHLALWLAILNVSDLQHIRNREEIEVYQAEAAQVLEEAFLAGRLTEWPLISGLLHEDSLVVRTYNEALAVVGLARENLTHNAQLNLPNIQTEFQEQIAE